jgi:hypothetical protein
MGIIAFLAGGQRALCSGAQFLHKSTKEVIRKLRLE